MYVYVYGSPQTPQTVAPVEEDGFCGGDDAIPYAASIAILVLPDLEGPSRKIPSVGGGGTGDERRSGRSAADIDSRQHASNRPTPVSEPIDTDLVSVVYAPSSSSSR